MSREREDDMSEVRVRSAEREVEHVNMIPTPSDVMMCHVNVTVALRKVGVASREREVCDVLR